MAHARLAWPRFGDSDIFPPQHLRTAYLVEADRLGHIARPLRAPTAIASVRRGGTSGKPEARLRRHIQRHAMLALTPINSEAFQFGWCVPLHGPALINLVRATGLKLVLRLGRTPGVSQRCARTSASAF